VTLRIYKEIVWLEVFVKKKFSLDLREFIGAIQVLSEDEVVNGSTVFPLFSLMTAFTICLRATSLPLDLSTAK